MIHLTIAILIVAVIFMLLSIRNLSQSISHLMTLHERVDERLLALEEPKEHLDERQVVRN